MADLSSYQLCGPFVGSPMAKKQLAQERVERLPFLPIESVAVPLPQNARNSLAAATNSPGRSAQIHGMILRTKLC
jgi:hypothetical protein